ncbi:MAG: ribonuclease P protein component [Candidatus Andersenbacteria bacterium]
MLQPQNRLRDSVEITQALRSGGRVRLPLFDIFVAPSTASVIRVACVVGKRAHAHAVQRHAIARRLRAACARVVVCIPGSYNVVIVGKSSVVLSASFEDIIRDIYYGILTHIA